MTKIALVTYEINQGGTNRVCLHLANGFAAAGHDVRLAACTSAGTMNSDFCNRLAPGIVSTAFSSKPWKSRALGQIAVSLRYRAWLKRERPDIVLATGNNISWLTGLGLFSVPGLKARFYIKTTNPVVREKDGFFVGTIRKLVYGYLFRKADAVMTLSDAETRQLQGHFPKAAAHFRTVYNAYISTEFAQVERARSGPAPDAPVVILGVGRLAAQKNFTRLLKAFAATAPQTAILRIAGDGEERGDLEALAARLGIADRIEFLGYVHDVAGQMAQADLFVLSSDYEGLPAVVVEALACDCPVISTDCFPNVSELLDNLPGCQVTSKCEHALASAMSDWLARPVFEASLKPVALNYSTQSSVDSHLRAMQAA